MLGVYQMAMSIFMVMLTVISSGLPLVMSREIAKHSGGGRKIFDITAAGLIIGVTASAVLCLTVFSMQGVLGFIFTDKRSVAILIALLPAVTASSVYCALRAVWWGQNRFVLLGLTELIEQIARVVLFVLFLGFAFYFTDLANLSAWSFSGACIISAAVVVIIFLKTNKRVQEEKQRGGNGTANYIKPLLKSAVPITGVRVLSSIAFPLISILLPLRLVAAGWDTVTAVSHFGIIVGMTFPLLTVPSTVISALATALVPELSRIAAEKSWDKARRQIKTSVDFTVFINFIFIPAFIALGAGIGTFLFATPESGIYLARSAWVMVPLSLSQITSATLNSLNAEKTAMRNYFIGSAALFGCVWFLPQTIGADAVIVGLGISAVIASALNIRTIRKITLWRAGGTTLSAVGTYCGIAVPAAVIGLFSYNIMAAVLPAFFTLLFAGTLSTGAFIALAWVFNLVVLPKKRLSPVPRA
jgi:stage V sporulation protein B